VLRRLGRAGLRPPADRVVGQFLRRASQLVATAAGLMKLHRTYEGPLIIRALFELALQFEYLMQDPVPRSRQYQEFTWVTQHRLSKAIAENPVGPVSRSIASSPQRAAGEAFNESQYRKVEAKFLVGKSSRLATNWYCMTIKQLADRVGWAGEYRLWYATCSAWAHADPFQARLSLPLPGGDRETLFVSCLHYYARMLLRVAGNTVLTSDQYGLLKNLARELS